MCFVNILPQKAKNVKMGESKMESTAKFISPLERPSYPTLDRVKVGNDFLGKWLNKIQTVTAKDVLTKFNAEGALANYERVAAGEKGGHVGPPW